MSDLTPHESWIVDDVVSVIDMASRVLLSADPGSHYQQGTAAQLAEVATRLAARLEKGFVPNNRAAVVSAAIARGSQRYLLGRLLYPDGRS